MKGRAVSDFATKRRETVTTAEQASVAEPVTTETEWKDASSRRTLSAPNADTGGEKLPTCETKDSRALDPAIIQLETVAIVERVDSAAARLMANAASQGVS